MFEACVIQEEDYNLDSPKIKKLLKEHPEWKEKLIKASNALKRYDLYKKHNGIHFYQSMPKTKLFHESKALYRLLHGANRCLYKDQEIYDPVLDVSKKVSEIDKDFHVLAFDGKELVASRAFKPFTKDAGEMFRVRFSNGGELLCSGTHLILTPSGYCALSELQEGCAVFQPRSSSGIFQKVHALNEAHCFGKVQDFQSYYHPSSHLYDEQLPLDQDTFSKIFPSQACVQKHTSCEASLQMDAQENKPKCNHSCQQAVHPSILDDLRQILDQFFLFLFQIFLPILKLFGVERQVALRPNRESFLQPQSNYELIPQHSYLNTNDSVHAYIESIEPIGVDVKWDFEVPDFNNYYAGGVINHNSGKSTTGGAEDCYYALGIHPYKKIRTPNEGWVVSLSYKQQIEGVQPIIMNFLPKNNIKRITYIKSDIIDTIWVIPHGKPVETDIEDCSKIAFKSCDSGPRLFAGAAKRWIHFDEEPTYAIYKECIARIGAGIDLDIWLTMTPIFEEVGRKVGMTWSYRELYQKRDGNRIATFGVGIEDNIYLSKEQVEEQKKKYYGAEYDIRIKGEFRLLSGNQVFDVEKLEGLIHHCVAPIKKGRLEIDGSGALQITPDSRGYLSIWKMPVRGKRYCIGADSGLGVGGDPSAATVRDMDTLELMATVKGQIAPDQFGEILLKLGNLYNKAWLGIEANSFGIATIDSLKHRYSKLYYRYRVDQRTDHKTKQLGWWTDTKTKPIMISDYAQAIREENVIIKDMDLFNECITYIIGEDGSANAESGCHDDLLIADMICFQVRKRFYMTANSTPNEPYIPTSTTTGY